MRRSEEDDNKMKSALAEKFPELKVGIDYKKLLDSFEMPKSKDGTIILNPNNSTHTKWFDLEDGEDNS